MSPGFGLGVVSLHERAHVAQIARVRPAAEKVAAHDQATELLLHILPIGMVSCGVVAAAPEAAGDGDIGGVCAPMASRSAAKANREVFTKPRRVIRVFIVIK